MLDRKIRPMLAYAVTEPFDSKDHLFEIKWDGTRCILFLQKGKVRLQNRRLLDITYRYPELQKGLPDCIAAQEAILDGELVVLRDGRPDFSALQQREHVSEAFKAHLLSRQLPATYIAFDLIYLEGEDHTRTSLIERKGLLKEVLRESEVLIESRFVMEKGREFFERVVAEGFEGVMAKELRSPYLIGKRSRYWLKIKPRGRAICYIIGYTLGEGRRQRTFGALLLASREGGRWIFRGRVGSGFSEEELHRILELLSPIERERPAFEGIPPLKKARWVEPRYRCEILYQELTEDGRFRAPVFLRLVT